MSKETNLTEQSSWHAFYLQEKATIRINVMLGLKNMAILALNLSTFLCLSTLGYFV